MSADCAKTPSPVTSTGTVPPPPARREAMRWMTWMWRSSRYAIPARSSAQRAFSQKWLIGMVISRGGAGAIASRPPGAP